MGGGADRGCRLASRDATNAYQAPTLMKDRSKKAAKMM